MSLFRPSFHLFARPSLLEGMCRAVDLGATLQIYNDESSAEYVDFAAMHSDWQAVGNDIFGAVAQYESDEK